MKNLIFFFTLCCIPIKNHSAQNEINEWHDVTPEFSALQNETKNKLVQAHTIMTNLRKLDANQSSSSINYTNVLPIIKSQIEELYKLSSLSETKIEEYNSSINRPSTFAQDNSFLIISNSLIIAEILLKDIFRKAQALGLYPEGYPSHL